MDFALECSRKALAQRRRPISHRAWPFGVLPACALRKQCYSARERSPRGSAHDVSAVPVTEVSRIYLVLRWRPAGSTRDSDALASFGTLRRIVKSKFHSIRGIKHRNIFSLAWQHSDVVKHIGCMTCTATIVHVVSRTYSF